MGRGMSPIVIVGIVLTLIFTVIGLTNVSIFGEEYEKDPLPEKISQLPEMDLEDVKTYEQYKNFVDKIDALISILNEHGGFDIPYLEATQESWSEMSKKINKYGPLIDNYQRVVTSAKKFEKNKTEENYREFYLHLGEFSLEMTLISVTLFHTGTFRTVGYVYRASGFNTLAFKCPSCVSTVLSNVYWRSIKTVLVEESSEIAIGIINELKALTKNESKKEELKDQKEKKNMI